MSQRRMKPSEDGSKIGTCHLSEIDREAWEDRGFHSIELDDWQLDEPRPQRRGRYKRKTFYRKGQKG